MPAPARTADVVVIGAGIAGAAAGDALARAGLDVLVLEREDRPGRHATGRSAAVYLPTYGPPPVWHLTAASLPVLSGAAGDRVGGSLLRPRPMLSVAAPGDEAILSTLLARASTTGTALEAVEPEQALAMVPVLRIEHVASAIVDTGAADLDVDGLHQFHLRRLRGAGGSLATSSPVTALSRSGDGWRVDTPAGPVSCAIVVDAAGAWGDDIALLAGLRPQGLTPLRRTAFLVSAPLEASDWPMLNDAAEAWYVKPDAGHLLCSPADETPQPPSDARPDELDIARAIEDINLRTTLGIRAVSSAWAGLRTFTPDRVPVAGPDPADATFFWSVGQGGYGIQTAPAMGELIAALVTGAVPPVGPDVVAALDPGRVQPDQGS